MRHRRFRLTTVLLAALLTLAACPRHATAPRPPQTLVTPVLNLTRALRVEIRYNAAGLPLTDDALLQSVLGRKPELARVFRGTPVRIRRGMKEVVVLVCTPDGKNAALEDASWTPMVVDRNWYTADQPHSCAFDPTLDPNNPPPGPE
jgi:hypothetical protein